VTPELQEVVDRSYRVFGRYRLNGNVVVCTCPVCVSDNDARLLAVTPLHDVAAPLLGEYTQSAHGLVEDEMRYFLPRYFELLASGEDPSPIGIEVCLARLGEADYRGRWPNDEVEVIDAFFAALFRSWLDAPARCHMGRVVLLRGLDIEELLCMVAYAGGDLAPLLRVWDATAGRLADLRLAAVISHAWSGALGNAFWDIAHRPELEAPMRLVFDWLRRAEIFERLDAALTHSEEPLERKLFESAIETWIDMPRMDEQ
jgi:hypothetical protein